MMQIKGLQTNMLPVNAGSIFVCGPLHHHVLLSILIVYYNSSVV